MDDAESLEQFAPKHAACLSTGMKGMDGDEGDKEFKINNKPTWAMPL